jgi:hypothetical protein
MKFDSEHVARALRLSWSLETARQWTKENPAAGQCNVTALLVHELFGGDLLKTRLPESDHFYNLIGGGRYDLTESQFDQPITYSDVPTKRAGNVRFTPQSSPTDLCSQGPRSARYRLMHRSNHMLVTNPIRGLRQQA